MPQQKYLNLGCGRVILPGQKPAHYGLIDDAVTNYALWHNVDRNQQPGVDQVIDLFNYPWPLADNAFDGALLAHVAEHIPHEIRVHDIEPAKSDDPYIARYNTLTVDATPEARRRKQLVQMQDGWFAFFSELYRVLTPGAQVYILSPFAWSSGGITDPSHTRLLMPDSFTHSMQSDPNAPFAYETGGIHFEMRAVRLNLTPYFHHLAGNPELLQHALETQLNVAYEFYVRLEAVK